MKYAGLIIVILILSCTKDESECNIKGELIGYDAEKCSCCPGFLIEYNSDTIKSYNIVENIDVWSVVRAFGYPISIRFSFKDSEGDCQNYKDITCISFDYPSNCGQDGEIIGYISEECLCCPGWVIKIGSDTIKIEDLPEVSKIEKIVNTKGYPIKIKLDYDNIDDYCLGQYKNLTCFELK